MALYGENNGRFTHGLTKHYLYKRWNNIKNKCCNSKDARYKYYGGRGITVFEEWRNSLFKFVEYIETELGLPTNDLTILDRIDNSKGYIPGNIRWANYSTSNRNQRKRVNISGYRWVISYKKGGFIGIFKLNNREYSTCFYKNPILAAIAIDFLAVKHLKTDAPFLINFPELLSTYNKAIAKSK